MLIPIKSFLKKLGNLYLNITWNVNREQFEVRDLMNRTLRGKRIHLI